VALAPGKLVLHTTQPVRDGRYNKILIRQWYRRRQRLIFRQQYTKALEISKMVPAPKLEIKNMTRRWGSFSGGNTIYVNPRLIYADTSAIRYVLLHELAHTKHRTHSKEFYRELEKYVPDWKNIKQKLEVRYGQYQL
jgi:predicted metal-dependent hydrolase